MNIDEKTKRILAACDHTLLLQTATWQEVREILARNKDFLLQKKD